MKYAIGVDVGGMSIKAGVVDENFQIVMDKAIPTLSREGADDNEKLGNGIAYLIQDICGEMGIALSELRGAGACIPGRVDSVNGVVVYANNIALKNAPLRRIVKEQTGIVLAMGNDADVAAYGESVAGASAGCESSLLITLGTGIGGGYILDGKIQSGWGGRGGEFGHTVVQLGGWKCTCGREGCVEAYASATGLMRMTRESMEKNPESLMWKLAGGTLDGVNGKTAFDAMNEGDAAGQAVVDLYIKYLACGLTNFINILHPQKICLGGGISHSGDDLLIPLRKEVYKHTYGGADEHTTEIVQAKLGNKAGIIGAAMLGCSQNG